MKKQLKYNPGSQLPRRWDPDSLMHCTLCETPFTLFYRRHHCRTCGALICSTCSRFKMLKYGGGHAGESKEKEKRVCIKCQDQLGKDTADVSQQLDRSTSCDLTVAKSIIGQSLRVLVAGYPQMLLECKDGRYACYTTQLTTHLTPHATPLTCLLRLSCTSHASFMHTYTHQPLSCAPQA
jgi:hypothetical protein